jgi:hypothetical protein
VVEVRNRVVIIILTPTNLLPLKKGVASATPFFVWDPYSSDLVIIRSKTDKKVDKIFEKTKYPYNETFYY